MSSRYLSRGGTVTQSKRSRVARLLLKAVRNLPEREQQVVLEYLVASGLGVGGEPMPARRAGRATKEHVMLGGLDPSESLQRLRVSGPGPGHQMIPVRLSEPQHRLLKDWCAENGFPMAAVVRGLVERFLEDQERRAA